MFGRNLICLLIVNHQNKKRKKIINKVYLKMEEDNFTDKVNPANLEIENGS